MPEIVSVADRPRKRFDTKNGGKFWRIQLIDHPLEEVRGDILYALDFVATSGSAEAVAKIEAIRKNEEGRAIWNHTKDLALAVSARMSGRLAAQ